MSMGQAREVQVSVSVMEIEWTLDLGVIPLPEGSLCAESKENNAQLEKIKGLDMNLAALPL